MGDRAGKTLFGWKHRFGCGVVWAVSSAHALCEIKEFSPQLWFSHAENRAKPCANRVSAVAGQILPSTLTLVSRPAPSLMSLRVEDQGGPALLCQASPGLLEGWRGTSVSPNPLLFLRQRQAVSPKHPSHALRSGGAVAGKSVLWTVLVVLAQVGPRVGFQRPQAQLVSV